MCSSIVGSGDRSTVAETEIQNKINHKSKAG